MVTASLVQLWLVMVGQAEGAVNPLSSAALHPGNGYRLMRRHTYTYGYL